MILKYIHSNAHNHLLDHSDSVFREFLCINFFFSKHKLFLKLIFGIILIYLLRFFYVYFLHERSCPIISHSFQIEKGLKFHWILSYFNEHRSGLGKYLNFVQFLINYEKKNSKNLFNVLSFSFYKP